MAKKRLNRSKKDIVSDIQLTEDAGRRRHLIKDVVFPFLASTGESIGYAKVFLQSFAGVVEGVYEERRKKTTIGQIEKEIDGKLRSVFKVSDPEQKREYERYAAFVRSLRDISVQDLAYASELPRYIDGYIMAEKGKEKASTIDIARILG